MRLFLQYLRGKAGKIAAFFLFAVIFIVSFALYHLPLAAVWYSANETIKMTVNRKNAAIFPAFPRRYCKNNRILTPLNNLRRRAWR